MPKTGAGKLDEHFKINKSGQQSRTSKSGKVSSSSSAVAGICCKVVESRNVISVSWQHGWLKAWVPTPIGTRVGCPAAAVDDQKCDELEILRQFDLNSVYGPCSGITRLERWDRAKKFNFNPPADVHQLILDHPTDERYTHCIWRGMKI